MDPADAERVAAAFEDHDTTGLPEEIGLTRRTLFRFHDLYMHLIEADDDVLPKILEARDDPRFRKVNEEVGRYLTPYASDWSRLTDSKAEVIYTWEA
nr:TcmF2 cyclase [Streptomyces olivaceus]